jgi:hypothetical protein
MAPVIPDGVNGGVELGVGVLVGVLVKVGVILGVGVKLLVGVGVTVLVGVIVGVGVKLLVGVTVIVGVTLGVGVGDTSGCGTFITTAPTHTLPGCLEPGGYNISLIFGCLLGAWYGRNFIYDKYNIGL